MIDASRLLGQNVNRIEHLSEKLPTLGLKRAELFLFSKAELPEIQRAVHDQNLAVSIHAPVPRPDWYPFPPTWTFLNYADSEKRQLYLRLVAETIETGAEFGAEYVVVHFPGPISKECEEIGLDRLFEIAHRSADDLAELSAKHGIAIHIEGFGPSPFLTFEFIGRVLERHPVLRYCFDVAHNHIAGQRDELDYYGFLRDVLPYLGSVHLWQTRHSDDYQAYRHIALHPSQRPEEGWVDVERVVRLVRRARPAVPFVMEYPGWFPDPWKELDFRDGVRWLQSILTSS